jgi:spectinomycin phosphotransferase
VLCHADRHGWNLFVDQEDAIYIVDWDTLIFAPKERDLMFIGAGIWDSGLTATEEESLFYHGYGSAEIHHDLIAYYRFERIIQDINAYCEFIFSSDKGGDDRMQCFEHLHTVFMANGAIDTACRALLNDQSVENPIKPNPVKPLDGAENKAKIDGFTPADIE